jgi:hypothetical protein
MAFRSSAVPRTALLLALATLPSVAHAQSAATDVRVRKPNVMLLIDTSLSMRNTLDGDPIEDCSYSAALTADQCNATNKSRWTILTEVLTGSVVNLGMDRSEGILVSSNGCRPVANLESDMHVAPGGALSATGPSGADSPYAWPTNNGNVEAKDAVAFCETHVSGTTPTRSGIAATPTPTAVSTAWTRPTSAARRNAAKGPTSCSSAMA